MNNAVRTVRDYKAIVLDSIYKSNFQKEHTMTAMLRQDVETKAFYPSMKPTNSMSDNLFSNDEFEGTEEQEFTSVSHRTAFLNVPEGTTEEEVTKRLAALPKARIYRILSNHPILTAEQKSAIANGITTKDNIANSQVSRYPEGAEHEGEIIIDINTTKPFYRATFFSATGKEDEDLRTSDPNDLYLSAEIEAELGMGQSVAAPIEASATMQEA